MDIWNVTFLLLSASILLSLMGRYSGVCQRDTTQYIMVCVLRDTTQ